MSDRIAVMDRGRVEQLGTPREIYFHPRSRFVADFIGTANLVPATIERLGEVIEVRASGSVVPAASIGSPEGHTPAVGDPVSLMLRPENLEVHRGTRPAGHLVETTVEDVIFQGTGLRLDLRAADGSALVALVGVDDRDWRPGDTAYLTWRPERAHVVGESR